jgi:hypothetical protein
MFFNIWNVLNWFLKIFQEIFRCKIRTLANFLGEVFLEQKLNWKSEMKLKARYPTECWKRKMAFCVLIRTHVIRGTIDRIPECPSHYAIEAKRLEKLYYKFLYFQIIYASLWQFQRPFSKSIYFNCSICFRFQATYFIIDS